MGKMVAYIIVHTDVGIPCLATAAYKYIASGSMDIAAESCSTEDVADLELRELINKVIHCYIINLVLILKVHIIQ